MNLTIDLNTLIAGLAVVLLGAVILGGFKMHADVTKLQAEFRAFRFEVLRYMEAHQGD